MNASNGFEWARISPAGRDHLSVGDLATENPRSERIYEILGSGPKVVWAKIEQSAEQFIVPVSRLRWRARRVTA